MTSRIINSLPLFLLLALLGGGAELQAQPDSAAVAGGVSGVVVDDDGAAVEDAVVSIDGTTPTARTNEEGKFTLAAAKAGRAYLRVRAKGYRDLRTAITLPAADTVRLTMAQYIGTGRALTVRAGRDNRFGYGKLEGVQETAIYAAKKAELILLDETTANRAANNARQVFGKVAGLNIWESDGAGMQLGIGGRGLSPSRTSNFNTRQNGYDIAADALGYPESYYTPPLEAIERIEVVRGAASLQYGTQFGGMLNFVMRHGDDNRPFAVTTRLTGGAWGFSSNFLSLGGTSGPLNYYGAYQFKRGDGWRENSAYSAHTGYSTLRWQAAEGTALRLDVTTMTSLAQQPGGLTDRSFEENPRQSLRDRNWFSVDWNVAALTLSQTLGANLRLNSRTFGLLAQRSSLGNLERITVADLGGERNLIEGEFNNIGNETRLMYADEWLGNRFNMLVGTRLYWGDTRQKQGHGSDGSDADFRFLHPDSVENSSYRNPSRNLAAFAEAVIRPASDLQIVPGIRFENIVTESEGFYRETSRDFAGNIVAQQTIEESRRRDRSFVLAGLGVGWNVAERCEVYANASQNYRAITFNDLRVENPSLVIDTTIDDERGFSLDLGSRGSIENILYFDCTAFYMRYADRIGTVLRSDRPPLFLPYRYRTNIGASTTMGIEAFVEADLWRSFIDSASETSLTAYVNLSVIDARYDNDVADPTIRGRRVELVPPVTARFGTTLRVSDLSVTAQYSWTAEQYSDATNAVRTSTAENGLVPSYGVADLSMSWDALSWLKIEAGINNLLDASYFTRRAESYPGPGILPSDGRSAYLTGEFRF